jgi:UDP-N-acetylglucosamine 2-epimerase
MQQEVFTNKYYLLASYSRFLLKKTERPEGIEARTARLVATKGEKLFQRA